MQLLRIDGPVFRFLETVANLLILNLLFVLCCIPVVTIGPALSALCYVALKMARKEETGIVRSFFHAFRLNFKQGLVLGLGVLLLAVVLAADLYIVTYVPAIPEFFAKVIMVVTILLLIVLAMVAVYLFAVLAQFDNTNKELLKWSAILAIRHLPVTVISVLLVAAPILILVFFPGLFIETVFPVMILLGFSLIAFLQAFLLVRVFAYYMPKDGAEAEDE